MRELCEFRSATVYEDMAVVEVRDVGRGKRGLGGDGEMLDMVDVNKPNAVPHLPAGGFDRPRCGNAHNASCKSKANRRRLRQRTAVPSGYAKVMRKLGFKLGVRHSYVRKGEGGS